MPTFSEVVAFSRDAQLRQAERERADQAFVEDVMQAVAEQVEAEGGQLSLLGEWSRMSENAHNTYLLTFPEGCNVTEVVLGVAGRVTPKRNVFMVGPSGRSGEPIEVKDRNDAAQHVYTYLMRVVQDVHRLHER